MENLRNLNEIARDSIRLRRPDWEVLRFPAGALNPTGPVQAPAVDPDSGALVFTTAQIQRMTGTAGLPHSMKIGGTVIPAIHYTGTSDVAGNVLIEFTYSFAPVGEAFSVDITKQYVIENPGNGVHKLLVFDEILTRQKPDMGEMITGRVSRIGTDVLDTYSGDLKIYEFTVGYQKDSFGSEEILTKIKGA